MKLLLWFPWSPGRVARELSQQRWPAGMGSLLFSASVWAGLSLALGLAAQVPAQMLLPIRPEHYYFAQALFVCPLMFAQATVLNAVCAALAGVPRATLMAGSATALGSATFWGLLVPDIIAYTLAGADGLRFVVALTGPTLVALGLLLQTRVLQASTSLGTGGAWGAAFVGLIVQALLAAPFLR